MTWTHLLKIDVVSIAFQDSFSGVIDGPPGLESAGLVACAIADMYVC